jgi:hypothetical protein
MTEYDSIEQAGQEIREFVNYYNVSRRHSSLDYQSPNAFELAVRHLETTVYVKRGPPQTLARGAAAERSVATEVSDGLEVRGRELIRSRIHELDLPFSVPKVQLLAMLHPSYIDATTTGVEG